jgi:membrane-bound lytic murein transglycosylase B
MIRNITRSTFPLIIRSISLSATLLVTLSPSAAVAMDTQREEINSFVDKLVTEHGFSEDYVRSIVDQSERKQKILDAISRPAEKTLAWHEYRDIFITPKRINAGRKFYAEHKESLQRISKETGVPTEIIVAIIGVETFYGGNTGSYRVLDALATLGFDYPPRSKFFRGELEQAFLLAREEDLEITDMIGSYAGAIGPPQFIPSSYRAYAVDGDGDGRRDLFNNWDDIFSSVANYFVAHKWKRDEPVVVRGELRNDAAAPGDENTLKMTETVASVGERGILFETTLNAEAPAQIMVLEGADGDQIWVGFHNFYVITRYNRSVMYALAVYQLSAALTETAGDSTAADSAAGK